MKKFLKITGIVLGVVVLIVAAAAAYFWFRAIPSYTYDLPADIATLQAPSDSVHVARGEKIASLLCNACHLGKNNRLTGQHLADIPAEFGHLASYNITQDKEYGIGAWSDGELYYFLRTGLRKDGSWAPPYMPKFSLMADDDVLSVIAWLRSDDPRLQPDQYEEPKNNPNFLIRVLCNLVFFPPPMPEQPITIPDSTDQLAFGRYLADGLCGCFGCHSADFKTNNDLEPEKSVGYYAGGNPMLNLEGEVVPSANITMDTETGIGKWTEEEFVNAVRLCQRPGGGVLYYPMFPHSTLTETEVKAIYAFMKTVPPVKHKVDRYQPEG